MSLQNRDIFSCLSEDTRQQLLASGEEFSLPKGALLFEENDRIRELYIVLEGYISLYRNSRYGDIKIIFVCQRGEALNETVIADERTAIAAKALSDAKVLRVHRDKLNALLVQENGLALTLFASMSYKERRLYHQVGNANRTYPLERKLAAKIWKMARDYGMDTTGEEEAASGEGAADKKGTAGRRIGFEITVVMLASMLGAKRETVSREISVLKNLGIITLEGGFLTVHDMDKLRARM